MAPAAGKEAESLQYLLLILKHSEAFKPNYHAVAAAAGLPNANQAYVSPFSWYPRASLTLLRQKKFKKLVEGGGFALVNGSVIDPNGDGHGDDATTPVATPKKATKGKKATTGSATKKRKVDQVEEVEDRDDTEIKPEAVDDEA